ncbi:hypothetical protein [Sulfuricurvum sp.]|uniref:hypothetical protein n=1 Tax=Sulfuricurvum sp. TaxID=2025608 RepID=UPI003BAF8FAE
MKLEPEDIIEITKTLEPHFKMLIETVNKELQRQINPFVLSSARAAKLLGLKSESTLRKRLDEGKYIEGFHYIRKNGKILWHRDNLWLEEFDKNKGIAS